MGREKNKIASLETEFHKEQVLRQKVYEKQMNKRTRRILIIGLVGILGMLFAFVRILQDGKELRQLQKEEQLAYEQAQQLKKEQASLQEEVTLLKDEDYVAKLARSRYLLTLDGEQVYAFPKDNTKNQESPKISIEKEK